MKTFTFVYDMAIVFLKINGTMLMKWLQSSSIDDFHLFMYSYIKAAEAEKVCSKWNHMFALLTIYVTTVGQKSI